MSLRNILTEKVIFPLSDKLLHQRVAQYLDFLRHESFYWNKEQMVAFQNKRLAKLITHAYTNVPFYTDLFDKLKLKPADIQSQEDLRKLPILSKKEMKSNYDKLLAKNISEKDCYHLSSSGSTGEPFKYVVSKDCYSFDIAANLRGWYWHGFKLGDRYSKLSVNPRSGLLKKTQDFVNNCVYFSSKAYTDESAVQLINMIVKRKVKFLRGYPSTLSLVADYILRNNVKDVYVTTVFTTGEILFPHMKANIEKAFHTKVADAYSGDLGAVMFSLPDKPLYHVAHEYAITEILDDKGNIVNEDKGEVITTNLWNYAMPFIRYNVKDIVHIANENSNEMFYVSQVEGRDVDVIVTPSGKQLIVHFFTGFFEWINAVDQFQVVQQDDDKILLKIIPNEEYTSKDEMYIIENIQEYIGEDVSLEFQIVDNIPLTKAGKRRFVIKK